MTRMGPKAKLTSVSAAAGLVLACALSRAWGADPAPPNFAPSDSVSWIAAGDMFMAPPSGPGPVTSDPDHPRITNAQAAATGKQPTFHMGDAASPILLPWAREELRKRNAEILAGKPGYTRAVSCWPLGVPAFLLGMIQPIYFVQTAKEVLITWQEGHEVRHVYMNAPHSARVTPSWFGESVGHYEGDTLVVDTIGLNGKTYVDHFRTPHTDALHVVERFRMIDGGKTLEVNIHVEDPGAFTMPWNAVQRFQRADQGPMLEVACAENNFNFFDYDIDPIPRADRPEF
jgi:hypothetical protein